MPTVPCWTDMKTWFMCSTCTLHSLLDSCWTAQCQIALLFGLDPNYFYFWKVKTSYKVTETSSNRQRNTHTLKTINQIQLTWIQFRFQYAMFLYKCPLNQQKSMLYIYIYIFFKRSKSHFLLKTEAPFHWYHMTASVCDSICWIRQLCWHTKKPLYPHLSKLAPQFLCTLRGNRALTRLNNILCADTTRIRLFKVV